MQHKLSKNRKERLLFEIPNPFDDQREKPVTKPLRQWQHATGQQVEQKAIRQAIIGSNGEDPEASK